MKKNIHVRIDFDHCRLFDETIRSDEIDDFVKKFKKKVN